MPAGTLFGQILDEKLHAWPGTATSRSSASQARRPAVTSQPPLFDSSSPFIAWGAFAGLRAASAYRGVTAPAGAAAHRPARQLSAAERQALDCLRGFGAHDLDAGATDAEIRRAFRALARRFHPDRHPEATPDERVSLSRDFAAIVLAYRRLTHASVH